MKIKIATTNFEPLLNTRFFKKKKNFFLLLHYPLNYKDMGKFTIYYLTPRYKTNTKQKKRNLKIEKTMGIN